MMVAEWGNAKMHPEIRISWGYLEDPAHQNCFATRVTRCYKIYRDLMGFYSDVIGIMNGDNWLVVSTYFSEKYEFVSWDDEIPTYLW